MQKLLLIVSICLLVIKVSAQQNPQYSQYMMNTYLINPAVVGIEDYTDIKTGYRNQWTNFEGAPTTFYVTAHLALDKPDRTSTGITPNISKTIRRPLTPSRQFDGSPRVPGHQGIGISLISDKTGPSSQVSLLASYAYHIPITGHSKLSIGASGGMTQYTLDFSNLQVKDNPDPAILGGGKITAWQPTINIGMWYYSRQYYIGASANQLLFQNYNYKSNTDNTSGYSWVGSVFPHYFVSAGWRQELNEDWAVIPSVLLKKVNLAPITYDINLKAIYNDRFWFGASYRNKDAVVALLGCNISSLINIGYSYDFTMSDLRERSRGTHEIVIGVMLNNRHRIICPQHIW
ncbi:PorP/SprF family type IX secretion system membrane protein [Flectobacillus major]|jgi:type IX secretion system PorP/SprF family membrane protein|uniref:PorP/SprF family type IX secretion system membrane protein n=1 Tax=Flectobacillus major TaxID=103 RepID=UPI00040790ED|nr:type IX secretion system membrane protein PorP/SprF [Flectobacillus major]